MRTDYTGNWKGSFGEKDILLHLKMESYELESFDRKDTAVKDRYQGVVYVNGDTLTFVQSMRYDYATKEWLHEVSPAVPAVCKVSGDAMTITYSPDVQISYRRVK